MNIFFAASPLHLICIREFINKHKCRNYMVYVFFSNENNFVNKQLSHSIELLYLKNIKKIYNYRNLFSNSFSYLILLFSLYKYKKYKNLSIIFADFKNTKLHFLRKFLPFSKFYLIDDGFDTYVSYKRFMSKNIYLPINQYKGVKGLIIKNFFFGSSFKTLLKRKINLFTIYAEDLNLNISEYNNLSFFKSHSQNLKNKLNYETVFLIGTKLYERNALSLNEELDIIKKINSFWLNKNKELIYLTKRTTSNYKINKIEELGIKTLSLDIPFELMFLTNNNQILPGIICTLGSTINKTISLINENIKIYFFVSNSMIKNKATKLDILYSLYFANKIKNLNLVKID